MEPIQYGKLTVEPRCNKFGQDRYYVQGYLADRRVQKYFRTIDAATDYAKNENDAHAKLGDTFISLTADDRMRLASAHMRAADGGYDLAEALTFFESNRGITFAPSIAQQVEQGGTESILLSEAKAHFDADQAKKGTKSNVCYMTVVNGLTRLVGDINVNEVGKDEVEQFLAKYDNPTTHNSYLKNVSTFFAYCVTQEWAEKNPADKVTRKLVGEKQPPVFGIESIKRLLRKVKEVRPEALGYYAICLFAGVRPEEVDRMAAEDVSLDEGYVRVPKPKTGASRVIMLDNCGPLRKWLEPTGGYLPDDGAGSLKHKNWKWKQDGEYRTKFQQIYKETGWDKWPNDILRNAFCSYHKEAFSDLELTNKIAGHSMDVGKKFYENTITELCKPDGDATKAELADKGKIIHREYAKKLWSLTPDKI